MSNNFNASLSVMFGSVCKENAFCQTYTIIRSSHIICIFNLFEILNLFGSMNFDGCAN